MRSGFSIFLNYLDIFDFKDQSKSLIALFFIGRISYLSVAHFFIFHLVLHNPFSVRMDNSTQEALIELAIADLESQEIPNIITMELKKVRLNDIDPVPPPFKLAIQAMPR